jgi:uncharacterized protein
MNPLLFYPGMIILGIGVGLMSGALGLGGGILMVPAFLTFVPGMDPHTAKGTSLLVIVFVAAVNVWRLNRGHDNWQWRLALQVASGSIVGGYLGGWVTQFFNDRVVIWIFIVLLGLAGLRTFFIEPPKVSQDEVRSHNILAIFIGFAMGLASGLSGIGGGAVLVPLALIAGLTSNERVVALSNMVMVPTCLAGAIAHMLQEPNPSIALPLAVGKVNLALVPLVFFGAQAGSDVGKWINDHLKLKVRRVVMGLVLIIITAQLLLRVL